MAEHSKKLYYRRQGETRSINLYDDIADVGDKYWALSDGSNIVYAKVGDIIDSNASHIMRRLGVTEAVLTQASSPDEWAWAKRFGGVATNDLARDVVYDPVDQVIYVTGYFTGTIDFGGGITLSSMNVNNHNGFIVKMNLDGTAIWASRIGSSGYAWTTCLALDNNRDLLVSGGYFGTTYFDGALTLNGTGLYTFFAAKISKDKVWQWTKTMQSGDGASTSEGICVDSNNNAYICCNWNGTLTINGISQVSSGNNALGVAKINASGTWSWFIKFDGPGGPGTEVSPTITCDSADNLVVTGYFTNPMTFGSYSVTSTGGVDIYVAKLNTSGTWLWAKNAGSTSEDHGLSVVTDPSNNIYVSGKFYGTATFSGIGATSSGYWDGFVLKMDSNGLGIWVATCGSVSSGTERIIKIRLDDEGNIYAIGEFVATATFGSKQLVAAGGTSDVFVAKLSPAGVWLSAFAAGGTAADYSSSLCVCGNNQIVAVGAFDGNMNFGSVALTSSGTRDIYVAKRTM